MPLTDLPLHALRDHRSSVPRPADLDAFWARTIDDSRALGREPRVQRVDAGVALVDVFDVTFSGWAGEPVRAWLHRPAGSEERRAFCCLPITGPKAGEGDQKSWRMPAA